MFPRWPWGFRNIRRFSQYCRPNTNSARAQVDAHALGEASRESAVWKITAPGTFPADTAPSPPRHRDSARNGVIHSVVTLTTLS